MNDSLTGEMPAPLPLAARARSQIFLAFLFFATVLALLLPSANARAEDIDEEHTLDVLIVYTDDMERQVGGPDAMRARANSEIEYNNKAYENSLITGQHRLVGVRKLQDPENGSLYEEGATFDVDLNHLTNDSDGVIDYVHKWRDELGADLVSLFRSTNAGGAAGVSWGMNDPVNGNPDGGFSIIGPLPTWSYAHEIGHNLGCMHDRANGGNPIFYYSHGLHMANGEGTIMSYLGSRIQYFSNPKVSHNGAPTGISELNPDGTNNSETSANNAKTINQTILLASKYRPAQTTSTLNITKSANTPYDEVRVTIGSTAGKAGYIRYTLDGSNVSVNSPLYSNDIVLSKNTLVKARLYTRYGPDSIEVPLESQVEKAITIQLSRPVIRPLSGVLLTSDTVTLLASEGSSIFYTVTDANGTTAPALYSSPLSLGRACTLRAHATREGANNSNEAVATFSIATAPIPMPSVPGGEEFFDSGILTFDTGGEFVLRYTLDGANVTEESPILSGNTLILESSATVKVRAYAEGHLPGPQFTGNYRVVLSSPILSPEPDGEINTSTPISLYAAAGAVIRYTLDGTPVTADSPRYAEPLYFINGATLRARAFRAGAETSEETLGVFPTPPIAAPVLSDPKTYFFDSAEIGFGDVPDGIEIRYTLDGTEPNSFSSLYDAPILLTKTTTVRASAFRGGATEPGAATDTTFTIKLPPVRIEPDGGTVLYNRTPVSLETVASGESQIRFTLDGSPVTAASPVYNAPFTLLESATLRARVFREGAEPSDEASAEFTVPVADAPDASFIFGTYENGVPVTLLSTDGGVVHYTLDGSEPTETDPVCRPGQVLDFSVTTHLRARSFRTGLAPSGELDGWYVIQVSTPRIVPPENTPICLGVPITIVSAPGARIYYTLDGSEPTQESPRYVAPFLLQDSWTVRARAFFDGREPSGISEVSFAVPTTGTPVILPASGLYTDTVSVGITVEGGAVIRYTLDGSEPLASSPVYIGRFPVEKGTVVRARVFRKGFFTGEEVSNTYAIQLSPPRITPASGVLSIGETVAIEAAPGATIRYTTDGSPVSEDSPVYVAPLAPASGTLRARAYRDGASPSLESGADYTFTHDVESPAWDLAAVAGKGAKLTAPATLVVPNGTTLAKGTKAVYIWKRDGVILNKQDAKGNYVSAKTWTAKDEGSYSVELWYWRLGDTEMTVRPAPELSDVVVRNFVLPKFPRKDALAISAFLDASGAAGVNPEENDPKAKNSVVQGEKLRLIARLEAGTGPFIYRWYKNNTKTLLRTTETSELTDTLETEVFGAKADGYFVTVETKARAAKGVKPLGTVKSAVFKPKVILVPDITSFIAKPASTVAGKNVSISVKVRGTAKLYYQWSKMDGSTPVPLSETKATLTLKKVTEADAGTYRVVVTNAAGETHAAFAVTTVSVAGIGATAASVVSQSGADDSPAQSGMGAPPMLPSHASVSAAVGEPMVSAPAATSAAPNAGKPSVPPPAAPLAPETLVAGAILVLDVVQSGAGDAANNGAAIRNHLAVVLNDGGYTYLRTSATTAILSIPLPLPDATTALAEIFLEFVSANDGSFTAKAADGAALPVLSAGAVALHGFFEFGNGE